MKCEKCNANALKGDSRCFWHSQDPAIIQKRQDARKQGGKTKAERSRKVTRKAGRVKDTVKTAADIKKLLGETLEELRTIETKDKISRARAIGYLSGIMLKLIETTELEVRLTELEKQMGIT